MRKISFVLDALSQLVFGFDDARARSAARRALDGAGKPAGVVRCEDDESAGSLTVSFDAAVTPSVLIRHLVEIERRRYAVGNPIRVRDLDDAALARLVAEATEDPELDESRILEHRVPELDG